MRRYARIMRRHWVLEILIGSMLFTLSGCNVQKQSEVIVLSDSKKVIFVEPNEVRMVKYPAVILSRGRYQQLIEFEMEATINPLRLP